MIGGVRWVAAALVLGMAALSPSWAQAQTSASRSSSFAYGPTSGLLTQEVIEPNLSAYRLQSDYTYNAFGQKTQVTVSGVDIATRSASTTYDSRGQFVTSASNALSQSESWQYDARFGLPSSHTGPNGLTTTWTYDGFGRKVSETRPDGTHTSLDYLRCGADINWCPEGIVYVVQEWHMSADWSTQIAPARMRQYDQLDRVIYDGTKGFDGIWTMVATRYDALGRLEKKSRPYFEFGGTPKWTTFTYDTLGRVLTETEPDTGVTTRVYNGLTTSVTNVLNQTQTTVKNSQDQIVSVTDALSGSTSYVYDPFSNLTQVTDAAGNITTHTYDVRGRKVATNDPDLGVWTYSFNVLDQLVSQTDAASHTTAVTYDLLGRMTQRAAPDLVASWTYDTAPMGIGKLATASTNTGYQRAHAYDGLGRPSQVQITIASTTYAITTGYDAHSRINAVTYPTGFGVTYAYNAHGYQTQLAKASGGAPLWTANARDAELHLTQQTHGNGIVTSQTFNANTGQLTSSTAGAAGAVQAFSYSYDLLGKLMTRADANTALSESFAYDALNRLTTSTVSLSPTPLIKSFTYNAIGNLTSKSDVGTYTYPAPGSPRPHGVISISGGVINTTFTYDAKGNLTGGNGLTIGYTSYGKTASISRGTNTVTFEHDPEHQRFQQVGPGGTTLYLGNGAVMSEKVMGSGGSIQWNNYLVAAGGVIGMYVEKSDETVATRYFHKDHLGSIAIITNEVGAVVERLSYDAWGKRRFANGMDDPAGSVTSQTTRGFTGHEQLADVGLIHMNGRVYDPLIGRFGSADPMTENPFSTQGWNRYSYVGNSPLNFTDPSGYCFLGCFWKPIFKAIGSILRTAIPIMAGALCTAFAPGSGTACAAIAAMVVTGVTTGDLRQALDAGVMSTMSSVAFFAVGEITTHNPAFGTTKHLANIAGHAAVGCVTSMASGGKCGPGAASGAVGSLGTPFIKANFRGDIIGGTAAASVLGGLASVAGGGKFANGAATAGYGYLFNAEGGRAVGRVFGGLVGYLLFSSQESPLAGKLGSAWGAEVGGQMGSDIEDWMNRRPTTGVLITNEGEIVLLESGPADPRYAKYPAAKHVEGKAAIWLRDHGSSGGTVYHNNTEGTCPVCNSNLPTLLPADATLLVIPPANAVAGSKWHIDVPKSYTGNSKVP